MNIWTFILCCLSAAGIGYTLGYHRAIALCKPFWAELKIHKGRMKTKWPKEIDTEKQLNTKD